MMIVSPWATN